MQEILIEKFYFAIKACWLTTQSSFHVVELPYWFEVILSFKTFLLCEMQKKF